MLRNRFSDYELQILDLHGARLDERSSETDRSKVIENFNLTSAEAGIYLMVLTIEGERYYKNILIIN